MADEQDAKQGPVDSSPTEPSEKVEATPDVADTSNQSEQKSEEKTPFHEHPRFQEIIRQNQELKARLEHVERSSLTQQPKQDELAGVKSRLSKLGLDANTSEELLGIIDEVSKTRTKKEIEPVIQSQQQTSVDVEYARFEKEHPECADNKSKMVEIYSKLSP